MISKYKKSIGKLVVKSDTQVHQCTAFIVSESGDLISTGHVFSKELHKMGMLFDLELYTRKRRLNFKARLVEFENDDLRGVDYSILKIEPNEQKDKFDFIKLEKTLPKHLSKSYSSYGYSIYQGGKFDRIKGMVDFIPTDLSKDTGFLSLKHDSEDLNGMSGGPVIIQGKCVAIQSGQNSDKKNKSFATQIDDRFENIINIQEREARSRLQLEKFVHAQFFESSKHTNIKREAILIAPHTTESEEYSALSREFRKQWGKFQKQLITDINRLIIFNRHCIQPSLQLKYGGYSKSISNLNDYYKSKSWTTIRRLRIAIQLQKHTMGIVAPTNSEISHMVEIQPNYDSSLEGFDACFSPDQGISDQYLYKVISDVITDISIFNSIPFLNYTFADTRSRNKFNELKKAYALKNSVNTLKVTVNDYDYITFSSCVKNVNDKINNHRELTNYWENFISTFVQESSENLFIDIMNEVNESQFWNLLGNIKKHGGNLPKRRLTNYFKTLSEGESYILARVIKDPGGKDSRALANYFGAEEYKQFTLVKIFEMKEMNKLAEYLGYLKILPFKKSMS